MPVHPTYPGVYIEEIPSGLRTITPVATSTAAFIGTFRKGLLNEAVQILSMADFEREYGGVERDSEASYAIQQFFLNGGAEAWVVRVGDDGADGAPHTAIQWAFGTLDEGGTALVNVTAGRRIRGQPARNPGQWGNSLRIEVEHNGTAADSTFNLVVSEVAPGEDRRVLQTERFNDLTLTPNVQNNALDVVNQGSRLIQLDRDALPALADPAPLPDPTGTVSGDLPPALPASMGDVSVLLFAGAPTALVGRARLVFPTPFPALTSHTQWAQVLQAAIRNAQHDPADPEPNPAFTPELRPYLTGATVDLIGTGAMGSPRRFVIRAGRGSRAYESSARLTFIGGGLDGAGAVSGSGAAVQPDAVAVVTGTQDLSALAATAGNLEVNGTAIAITAGDGENEVVNAINGATAATNVAASLDAGHQLVLTGSSAAVAIDIGAASTAAVLAELGLAVGVTDPVNLLTQAPPVVAAGETLTVQVDAGPVQTITFGTGPGEVSTLAELNTALGALTDVLASVDANGNLSVVAENGTDPVTLGGTATLANFGIQPAPATFTTSSAQQYGLASGNDGSVVVAGSYIVPPRVFQGNELAKTGLYALEDVDLFNILCIPDAPRLGAAGARTLYAEAETYVEGRRAMLIVDIPESVRLIDQMQTWLGENEGLRHPNGAVYYPRTFVPDPRNQNRQRSLASSGTIAGLWARTDVQRGVWKAPAGTDARLRNVDSLAYVMTDMENGTLNPLGVNCLRSFPVYSNICWGARTLEGADLLASDWKYVPVRRTTLFLEESLYRGTKWVVFEPNDEPLWAQIRLNVGAFMQDMFRKGAFQGTTPQAAYFVKCDNETTTQQDIDNGIVNIEVGFAPLKPAEFVIIKIQQIVRAQPA
jgi:phage tail sheath protein FI